MIFGLVDLCSWLTTSKCFYYGLILTKNPFFVPKTKMATPLKWNSQILKVVDKPNSVSVS